MRGREVKVAWAGRSVAAYVPSRIDGFDPPLDVGTVRRTERAAAAVVRLGDRQAGGLETVARLLLRSEGLASSFIEGVRASVTDVAIAEVDEGMGGAAGWVADNLAAVHEALADDAPLTSGAIRAWHRRLMRHSDLGPGLVGAWRDRQGWVGGASPLVAAYVPPPASEIDELMSDLVIFANRDELDPITHAALIHAQFETIHPFADGNGRIGRILIARCLKQRLEVGVPPPVSVRFARDIGGYISGLTLFRQGGVGEWVAWFAGAVEHAANDSGGVLDAVARLRDRWREAVRDLRRDSAARRLVETLVEHPVVNASIVVDLLGTSEQAARTALGELQRRGVVARLASPAMDPTPGRPPGWWVATELLEIAKA